MSEAIRAALARIDLNKLPEKAEATKSVVQITLTEGAIGYRHFDVVSGEKMMAVFRLADGDFPPFGAEVKNERQQQLGTVADDGNAAGGRKSRGNIESLLGWRGAV